MKYQQEFYFTLRKDIEELIKLHWEEVALNKEAIKLNPDYERYEELDAQGVLKFFSARENGELVGYFAVVVQKSLHYQDHLFANNDVLFLHPKHRKGLTGMKLIRFAENCLKADGVSLLTINTKTHLPFDALLKRMGYIHIENIYSKRFV